MALKTIAYVAALAMAGVLTVPAVTDVGAASAQENASDVDTSMVQEMAQGDENAPVTMIEYASFTCPHCAAFHEEVYPQLKADYIDTGKVRFINREVYFDRLGLWAGITARCGDGEAYFGIADMIYDQQREWTQGADAGEIVGNLRTIGKTAGLTDSELDACFTDADHAQALYATFVQTTEADGIEATPTFIINGEQHRNMSYDDLKAVLDAAIADATN